MVRMEGLPLGAMVTGAALGALEALLFPKQRDALAHHLPAMAAALTPASGAEL